MLLQTLSLLVGAEGLEPPDTKVDRVTAGGATNYALHSRIFHYIFIKYLTLSRLYPYLNILEPRCQLLATILFFFIKFFIV